MKLTTKKAEPFVELSLNDSEIRYRRLFETAQDGILILDAKTGMIEDVNPYLIKMLGYSRAEFIKKKLWEVGAFKDIEASQDAFEALQKNEYIRYEDLPLKTKDGRLIQVEFVSNVYRVGKEKVIQCNIRDITEHKRIIAALQENEKKYHDMVNQSPDGIFIVESSGNILTVNKAMCKELKFSEEELLSMNIWDIIPEQYLDQYRERLSKILEGKSLEEAVEYAVHGKDGKIHYIEVLSAPHYSGKDIIGFQGIARDITARKRAEEELRQSEDRYKRLFENMRETIVIQEIVVDDAGKPIDLRFLDVNPAAERVLGKTRSEIIGRTRSQVSGQTDPEGVEMVSRVISTNTLGHMIRPSPGYGSLFESFTYSLGSGRVATLASDITERKRAEEALKKSEASLEEAQRIAHLGSWEWDAETDTPTWSKELCAILEVDPTKPVPSVAEQDKIYTPESMKRMRSAIEQAMAGTPYEIELERVREDGTRKWLLARGEPRFDKIGHVTGLRGTALEITERKRAEDALRAASSYNRRLIEASIDPLVAIGPDGKITDVNEATETVTGVSRERLIGDDFSNYFTEPEKANEGYQKVLAKGLARDYPLTIRHISGKITDVFYNATVYKDAAGNVQGVFAAAHDITERKQAEIEIRQRLSELEVLYQSGLAFSQLINPKAIAEKIIELLDQKMDWHHTAVRLYHPESETLELLAFHLPKLRNREERSAAEEQLKSIERTNQGLSGWVIQHGQTVRSNDLKNDPRYFETFPGLQSGLYTPIKINERIIGVISIESEQAQAFTESDERLAFTLAGQAAIAIENATLFEDAQCSNSELMLAYETTLEGWSHALDLRDKETEGHTQRVTEMAVNLARAFGLGEAELVNVRRGALLHDIGKMGVPDKILLKPGVLTEQEWEQMRMHPVYAYDLLSHIGYLHEALNIPHYHHEKWDGSGYPDGLKGAQIPLAARIFAVVDVWDALISDRPYRVTWTKDQAREYILASSGTHFDPQVVDVFMQIPN